MAINSISVNCATSQITITGTGLSATPMWSVLVDDVPVIYELISASTTESVIKIIPFPDGEYCIAPLDTTLQSSDGDDIETSNSFTIYAVVDSGYFCATFSCSIQTTDSETNQWKLYRFDIKVRAEDSP